MGNLKALTDTNEYEVTSNESWEHGRIYFLKSNQDEGDTLSVTVTFSDKEKYSDTNGVVDLNLPKVTNANEEFLYTFPSDLVESFGGEISTPTPAPTPTPLAETYPNRIYLQQGSGGMNQLPAKFHGYYTLQTAADFSGDNLTDDTGETFFDYYQNDNNSSAVIILDYTEQNYNTGVSDKHHVIFDKSFDMPYSQSEPGGGNENLVTSAGATWKDNISILLESEVNTPTPIPASDPTGYPATGYPATIYVTNISVDSGNSDVTGEYTLKPAKYFNMQYETLKYYENDYGYMIWLDASGGSTHIFVNSAQYNYSYNNDKQLFSDDGAVWEGPGGEIVVCEQLPCDA